MEVLTRHGIRASAPAEQRVCDHHPEIIEEAGRLGWELIGHNQTNALRLTEMDAAEARRGAGDHRPHQASVRQAPSAGWRRLAETWNTLDTSPEASIRCVCDWVTATSRTSCSISAAVPLVSLPLLGADQRRPTISR
jgi:hypothetical protein